MRRGSSDVIDAHQLPIADQQSGADAELITAAETDVSRETAYYAAHIGKVTSIDDFLGDQRLFAYAMKAFGLTDMTFAKAFMRKVLTEGVCAPTEPSPTGSPTSAMRTSPRLSISRLLAPRGDPDDGGDHPGTSTILCARRLETEPGAKNEGVRLALYFQRKAAGITNVFQILADPALTKVVQTALGLSDSSPAMANIDQQAAYSPQKRLDLADFQDPAKLSKFLQRFAAGC